MPFHAIATAKIVSSALITVSKTVVAYSTAYLFNSHVYEPLANTASDYAKTWGLYEYRTATSKSIYNFTHTNLSPKIADFGSLLAKNFFSSLKDAMLLDGIVFYVLGGSVLPGIIGATIAYDLRTSINSCFENSKPHRVAGGFFAGAIKYGIVGLTLDKKALLIGAMNNAAYEYFKTADNDPITNNDVIGLYTSLFQIEGIDAALNVMLKEEGKFEQLITTLKVTVLLSASVWGLLQKSNFSELKYTHTAGILNHVRMIGSDILHISSDILDIILQKPASDDLENKEIIMNTTLHYNPKTQCALKDFTPLDICTLDAYYDELSQNTELNNVEAQQNIKEDL